MLDCAKPLVERVELPLQTDEVGLAQRHHVDGVSGVVDDVWLREFELLAEQDSAQRIAEPQVEDERTVGNPALDGGIVYDERLVQLGETTLSRAR